MSGGIPTGRLPADKAADGRQAMWQALKQTPDQITVAAIAKVTKLHRWTVAKYLKALAEAGHLEVVDAPTGLPGVWRLINDIGHHAPRVRADGSKVTQGEVYNQLWRSMYMLKDFTFQDLIQSASIEISENTAKDYCKRLLAAGYLKVLRKADPHKAQVALYRLIRHSGPKAPQVQKVRRVFDPNSGQVYAGQVE